jgi:hypothetical protein
VTKQAPVWLVSATDVEKATGADERGAAYTGHEVVIDEIVDGAA